MTAQRPITLLIAALGGEGGGVLTQWIVSAAEKAGFPVQSTSIPGVAQRTGATTYYVEIFPVPARELGGKLPVLALTPGVGDIDIAVASELLETGRTVANGFVTRERTHVIGSLSRFFAMDEKIAMGDGRFDQDKLIKVIKDNSRDSLLVDMDALAKQSGSIINAVMLGAIAGSNRLPIKPEQFEMAIREDGKSVDGNLRGFHAGFEAARANAQPAKLADKKENRRRNAGLGRTRSRPHISGGRAGHRPGRRTTADRLSERHLCMALSQPSAADHRSGPDGRRTGQAPEGDCPSSCRAHVL